jgi:hypothetical protein
MTFSSSFCSAVVIKAKRKTHITHYRPVIIPSSQHPGFAFALAPPSRVLD